MEHRTKAMQSNLLEEKQEHPGTTYSPLDDGVLTVEQRYRAGGYRLLASLLSRSPDQVMLDWVSGFSAVERSAGVMALSMSMLGLAASTCRTESIDDEFHALFIGLGRGELVPYGSWYLTGFLMERPLARLKDDLARLGFQRDPDVHEPEDHVAALCEVMQLLISDQATHEQQAYFFNTHMAGWIGGFFEDLSEARSAVFYRAVGRFGSAFIEFEKSYQTMQV